MNSTYQCVLRVVFGCVVGRPRATNTEVSIRFVDRAHITYNSAGPRRGEHRRKTLDIFTDRCFGYRLAVRCYAF